MAKQSFSPGDLFQFERMVAPTVLKIVYWIGLAGIVIYMLMAFAGALRIMDYAPGEGIGLIVVAIIGGAFAFLFWRIMIEVYMVLFGIYERLGEVRDHLRGTGGDDTTIE